MITRITHMFFSLALVAVTTAAAPGRPPNILLIISDDLRDSVGSYGNPQVLTPHLDAFAAGAVRFDRAYAQYPVCGPSRASFLTGLRPETVGVLDNRTPLRDVMPDVTTWPQHLRQHGWHTAAFGKVFHTVGHTEQERAVWLDRAASWDEAFYDTAERLTGTKVAGRNLTGGALPWCEWAAVDCPDEATPDGQSATRAIAAMEQAGSKPWFIAVGFHRPHDPFIAPQKYFDLYPAGSLSLKRDPADQTPAPRLALPSGAFKEAFAAFTDRERLEFLRAYYAGVSFMDAQVGRVLAALDRLGGRDNTLVIFMGDNGYHLGERAWWNKDTLFERSCRVPLLVRPPASMAGSTAPTNAARICPTPVELVDLFPTVLDYLGLPPPGPLAGKSLRAQLIDPARPGKGTAKTIVVHRETHGRTVRTPEWRYTEWTDGAAELYDEIRDPEETHNVATDPANSAVIARLQALLPAKPKKS
jgi:uncharacterized sulfatase